MAKAFHKTFNNYLATLDADITSGATSLVLSSGHGLTSGDAPVYLNIGTEVLDCTAIAEDSPTAGKATLTVVRGVDGTSASAHSAGDAVEQNVNAIQITEQSNHQLRIEQVLVAMTGGGEGVIRTDALTELEVQQTSPASMSVLVKAGSCIVDGGVAGIDEDYTTPVIVAPVSLSRIDVVQIDSEGNIEVKTGVASGSPTAPAVDSDALKLAEISISTGTTSITTGLITDSRVYV